MSRTRLPSYRHYRPTGQAVVTIRLANGKRKDVYLIALGDHGRVVSFASECGVNGGGGGVGRFESVHDGALAMSMGSIVVLNKYLQKKQTRING